MSKANFNVILHPEARLAAQDMEKRLGIPSIELTRLYQIDKIRSQYQAFAGALGGAADDTVWYDEAAADAAEAAKRYGGTTIAVGEMQNRNAFEMALALTQYGFVVKEIYASVSPYDFAYIRRLEALSPDTEVYSNLSPSMLYYEGGDHPVELTIGKDAAYYHDDAAHVFWDEEIQPFGYDGLRELLRQISAALEGRSAQ